MSNHGSPRSHQLPKSRRAQERITDDEDQLTAGNLLLDEVLVAQGSEVEHKPTRARFVVECVAQDFGMRDASYTIVLVRKLGMSVEHFAVPYEDLVNGQWSNLGL